MGIVHSHRDTHTSPNNNHSWSRRPSSLKLSKDRNMNHSGRFILSKLRMSFKHHNTDNKEHSSYGVIDPKDLFSQMISKELAEKTRNNDNSSPVKEGTVSRFIFESAFNGPLQMMGSVLYTHIQVHNTLHHKKNEELISEKQFNRVCKEILGLYSESQKQEYYFHLFSKGQDSISKEDVKKMVELCYTLSLAAANITPPEQQQVDTILEHVADSMFGIEENLTCEHFMSWSNRHCPHIYSGVHSWLLGILTKQHSVSGLQGSVPIVDTLQDISLLLTLPTLWVLSSVLPPCYSSNGNITDSAMTLSPITMMNKLAHVTRSQHWSLLFDSNEHGLSMNRFHHHVFSYRGPTITLLSFGKNVYCIASDTEWREGTERWGGSGCMVLQLAPYFRKVQEGEKMLFLNTTQRSVPKGIQVGKDGRNLVLEIGSDMSTVKNYSSVLSLHKLEVWGCAGTEAVESQRRQKHWENKEAERHANKKLHIENWKDCPDRQILEMAGIPASRSQSYIQDVSMDG